jgi:hypothetical protein
MASNLSTIELLCLDERAIMKLVYMQLYREERDGSLGCNPMKETVDFREKRDTKFSQIDEAMRGIPVGDQLIFNLRRICPSILEHQQVGLAYL